MKPTARRFRNLLGLFRRRKPAPHLEMGRRGENLAARYLRHAGLRIIARRVRTPYGEIDLVGREGPTWVFVEVKTRNAPLSRIDPARVIPPKQRRRLNRAARAFLRDQGRPRDRYRFDLVLVGTDPVRDRPVVRWFPHLTGI